MAAKNSAGDNIQIRLARPSDIRSLSTILARSFHAGNAYVKSALPDTPAMRAWWRTVFSEEIDDAACYPLVAVHATTAEVVGFVCQRQMQSGSDTAAAAGGFWTKHAWTDDHDETKWRFIIDCLVHWEEQLMQSQGKKGGEEYMHLELMGVDHAYQGTGIGRRLVERACEIADEKGCAMFLQSGGAKDFYSKLGLGFRTVEEPEWGGYQAYLSLRDAGENKLRV